jgi:hypothetical protein
VNLTECEIRSVLFGPHGRAEEWNLTEDYIEKDGNSSVVSRRKRKDTSSNAKNCSWEIY